MSNYLRAGTTKSATGLGLFGSQRRPGMPGTLGGFSNSGVSRYSLGAITQTPLFNYRALAQSLADQTFATMPFMTHVVVSLDVDGGNPDVAPFSDQAAAGNVFEDVIATPGSRAYVGEFGRDGIIGEQFFSATSVIETRFTFEKLKSAAPWIIAGVVAVGGLIYWAKRPARKAKRARAKPRHRLARARRRGRR